MTQPFVVSLRLTGDGRQAVQATGEVRRELEALQEAAANANQSARQAAINAAVGLDRAPMKARAADVAAYGEELDRLRARYNPVFAASQAYNRELDGINHAHRIGAINAQEQASAIAALNAQYKAAAASADTYQAAAVRARSGAANANALNLGFQAQDIAMMTLMGQAPGMLALQQGMQVGGIFAQMGGGRAIVQGLGSALATLLNPLNLATIAIIGLGAAGVQSLMGMMSSTDDATSSLERHEEMLDRILAGYDKARNAAEAALDAALKLPEASVQSNVGAEQSNAADRALEAMERALVLRREFEGYVGYAEAFNVPQETIALLNQTNDVIRQIAADGQLTRQELDQLHTALTLLGNNTADQNIKDISAEALALVDAARAATAEVMALDDAMTAIDRDIRIRISMSQEFGSAFGELQGLYQDPRSRFDQMREQAKNAADQALATATSYGQAVGAAEEYQRVLASINTAEAEANERAEARSRKPLDQWQSANDNFRQRIDSQKLELSLLGQSTYEVQRQKAAFDLLNQARQAGVQITEPVIGQINRMADEYAAATVRIEQATAAQAALDEQINFYRGTFGSFVSDMKSGLREGQTFWEAFGNAGANALDRIADRALGMAADGIFNLIMGAFMPGGGQTGGIWGSGLWGSAIFNAKGNVFASTALSAYSNQIVDRPTMFAFAKGAGIMGEAGAEAIIPLTRTASGDLGVRMTGDVGAGISMGGITFAPVNNFYGSANMGAAELARLLDQRDRRLLETLPQIISDAQRRARMVA